MLPTEEKYTAIVKACAEAGVKKAQSLVERGFWPRLYLYATTDGQLVLLSQTEADMYYPDDGQLVTGESLPPSLSYDRYYQWIWDRARRVPLFPSV